MFSRAKIIRTQALVIAVAVMLVLAGCATQTDSVSNGEQVESSPADTPDSQVREEDSDYRPDSGQNLSEYSNDIGAEAAGLNDTEKQQVEELIIGFYDNLPANRSERREQILDSADRLCDFDQQFEGDARASMLEESSQKMGDAVRRAHFAAQIANEFNGEVPVEPLDDFRKAGDVLKYAPLLASYNQMSDKACVASRERTDSAIQEYQIAVVMFGVDTVLVSTGAFYRPAFAGTRFTANKASQLGLYRLRYVCGNRCWALGMSEVHVALRGSMLTVTSNLFRRSAEMGVNLTRDDFEAVAQAYDTDVETLLENSDISIEDGNLTSISDDVVQCSEAALDQDKEDDESGEDGLFGDGEIEAGDFVNKSQEAVNKSKEFVENCKEDD